MEGSCSSLILRYYPDIYLEGLRKTTKYLSMDSMSLGRDLNLGHSEYEAGVLTTDLDVRYIIVTLSSSLLFNFESFKF
jgi:hypothetical protein